MVPTRGILGVEVESRLARLVLTIGAEIDQNRLIEIYDKVSGGKTFFNYDGRNYRIYGGRFTNDLNGETVELTLERDDKWEYREAIFEPYRGKECLP